MHVRGIIMDLNWLLQFIFTVFVIGLCWLHLVKNTASKNFEVNDNIFEAAESNHGICYPSIVNQAIEAEEDSFRCVNCGNFGIYRCSRCKSERYCSHICQIKHWKAGHRLECKDFRENSSRTANSNSKPIKKRGKAVSPPMYGNPPTTVPVVGHQTSAEALELAMEINGSIQSTKEDNPLHPNTHQSSGVINPNGWEDPVRGDSHNRWGATVASRHSAASSSRWMDEAPKEDYNRWGVPNMGPSSSQGHVQTHDDDIPHVYETSSGNTASVSSAPSAPPIPDWALDEGPIHDPSIDFCPVDLSVPAMEHGASVTSDVNEGGTSSCIICWEAPIECACIPCGHMAGCMTCLSEIKAKKGVCPVCRSKINQVVRLYAV